MNARNAIRGLSIILATLACGGLLAQSSTATVPGENGMLLTEMNNSGASTLHVVDPQNGKATKLRTHGSSYDPAFSPNGKSIAYVSNPGDQLWSPFSRRVPWPTH